MTCTTTTMLFSAGDSPVLRARLEKPQGHFIALVIASGQMASMAKDSVTDGSGLKKAAIGAASVVALRLAGAISWPVRWRDCGSGCPGLGSRVPGQAPKGSHWPDPAVRTLVSETRTRFEEIQGGYRAGRYDQAAAISWSTGSCSSS